MAAPFYYTDLVDYALDFAGGATSLTNWTAIGTGGAGLQQETDYFIQGTNCASKDAWGGAIKGMICNIAGEGGSTPLVVPTDGAVMYWMTHLTPNSLNTKAGGGIQGIIGSSASDYQHYYIAGSDTEIFGGWVLAAYDPNEPVSQANTGSPSTSWAYVGGLADLPTGGPSKGSPFGIDAIRAGRGSLICTLGDSGNPANFANANYWSTDINRRLGLLSFQKSVYQNSGRFAFGNSSVSTYFSDSNKTIVIREHDKVSDNFNTVEIVNASTYVDLTNITFIAATPLGNQNPGRWITTDNAQVNLSGCSFNNMGNFDLLANTIVTGTTWNNCKYITAANSTITDSTINSPLIAGNTSVLIWDVPIDPSGKIENVTFTKSSNSHHAIELGTTSPLTVSFTGLTSTGFNASDSQSDSFFHVKRTSGTVTINVIEGTGNFSYLSAGATVNIVQDPVTSQVTVTTTTGTPIEAARVLLEASNGTGVFPYREAVTIAQVGGQPLQANVSHTSHGMATGDKVAIRGANEIQYNGVFSITVNNSNFYEYTMGSDPGGSATGTITATGVVLEGNTNASGLISSSRTWSASQPVSGTARKGTSSPLYKAGSLSGTVSTTTGFSTSIALVRDE